VIQSSETGSIDLTPVIDMVFLLRSSSGAPVHQSSRNAIACHAVNAITVVRASWMWTWSDRSQQRRQFQGFWRNQGVAALVRP
jgi:hypothetical protein